jgi:hypothetical protein
MQNLIFIFFLIVSFLRVVNNLSMFFLSQNLYVLQYLLYIFWVIFVGICNYYEWSF